MKATYYLEFELSYNTWTDLAADWRADTPLVIERGIEPGERVARVGRMTLALHNPDGRYTPGHANARAGFEAGIGVRLRASDGVNTYTLFYGRLAEIVPRRDPRPEREAALIAVEDDMAALGRVPLDGFPLLLDVSPQEVINRLVDAAFAPPGVFGTWRLGHPQASLLGQTTLLPGPLTGKDLDAGQSVFPWVGDTWPTGQSAYAALLDAVASEGGFFYLRADGTPVFADRHRRQKQVAADATLSAGLRGLSARRERGQVANTVEVIVHPREVGAEGTTLWQSAARIRLAPGQPRTITCPYVDPDQQVARIGALAVIPPERVTDFTAAHEFKTIRTDVTDYVDVTVEPGATSARLTLLSRWPDENGATFVENLRLRGTPLRSFQPTSVALSDDASRLTYGDLPLTLDMPLQEEAAVAGDMAAALLTQRKDPHPWLTVEVEATASASLLAEALARDVGDRLHVTDSTLALNAFPCFVESVRHEVTRAGARHRVMWRTSPADLFAGWLLGQSRYGELGLATRLGY